MPEATLADIESNIRSGSIRFLIRRSTAGDPLSGEYDKLRQPAANSSGAISASIASERVLLVMRQFGQQVVDRASVPTGRPHRRAAAKRTLIRAAATRQHRHRTPPIDAEPEMPVEILFDRQQVPRRPGDRVQVAHPLAARSTDDLSVRGAISNSGNERRIERVGVLERVTLLERAALPALGDVEHCLLSFAQDA
jgi:hypothetical protein